MTAVATDTTTPLQRAIALQPLVRDAANEAEATANPVESVVRAMADAGLYRVCAPKAYGGDEADPRTTIEVIEAISAADGGTGWALMIGIETVGLGLGWMPPQTAAELARDRPDLVLAGALNPVSRARRVEGGYVVNGRWPFGSGCMYAHFFWGMCVVEDASGRPTEEMIEVVVPRDSYEVLPTWQVNGLRSSGSHDVAVADVFVPDTMVTQTRHWRPQHEGPLFRLPPFSRLAYNKVGVSLGIARNAIDRFVELANEKTPRLSRGPLRERPRAQLAVAEAEAVLRSARAFAIEAAMQQWETVSAGGVSDRRERALVRLASSHACQEAVRAVGIVASAAGTSINPVGSVLGRCVRDVAVVPQQLMVAPHHIEAAGRVLLGLDPGEPAF